MSEVKAIYPLTNNACISIVECNEEYVTYIDPLQKKHLAKIYTDTNRAYFRAYPLAGKRVYLDECLRV